MNDDFFSRLEASGLIDVPAPVAKDPRTFLQRVEDDKRAAADAQRRNQSTPTPATPVDTDAYIAAAHSDEIQKLAALGRDSHVRNHNLNVAALKLARLPIDRELLRSDLVEACHANGLAHDDGLRSVEATIRSAFTKADTDGPRTIPERPDIGGRVTEVDANELAPVDVLHRSAVDQELRKLRARDEARELLTREKRAQNTEQLPAGSTLNELLAQLDDDVAYRIDELLPTGGRVLLAAQFKAGKTTLVANLIRSLVDGAPFLGRFTTKPATVVLIDNEMSQRQLRRQLRDQGVINGQAVTVFCLRGQVSTFDLLDPETRTRWAELLRGADVVILDCLRPVLDALGLDESREAGRFLIALDELLREAGVTEAILVHHMGHQNERSRGDSRLLDWPDALWKIVRDNTDDDPAAERYFSAYGRDVDVREGKLDYTSETRSLLYLETNRAQSAGRSILPDVVTVLEGNGEGLSFRALQDALVGRGHPRKSVREAIKTAVAERVIYTTPGAHNATLHHLNPSSVPECASSVPAQ